MNYPYFVGGASALENRCPVIDDRMRISTVLFLKTRSELLARASTSGEAQFSPLRIAGSEQG
jgi:hypothetical protein